jgi:dihydroorotate dehydrogenase
MRTFIWRLAKWILFRLDAEKAHRITVRLIRLGIIFGPSSLRIASGVTKSEVQPSSTSPIRVFGLEFQSRLGLAAGFDKNAEILTGLSQLGFGFAEIGTVTPRAQPGNSLPRLFRDPAREVIFNRMGFNGLGASIVSGRVALAKQTLPDTFRVGVNLGKNKDTPMEKAWEDYVLAARPFEGLAD